MSELNFVPHPQDAWLLTPPPGLPYISATAISRVRDALPKPTECRYCQGTVVLVNNREIYGTSVGNWPFVYRCQGQCEAYVGVHADTDIPLGILADAELRKIKVCAKQSFHTMMYSRRLKRTDAYNWLAEQLGIPASHAHYGWFDMETVKRAYAITQAALNEISNP